MRNHTIDVRQASGKVLFSTVFCSDGTKLLRKGHLLKDEDVRQLQTAGLSEVSVAELESGDMGEAQAVTAVAMGMARGALQIQLAPGGRANVFTTEPSCILVDEQRLQQLNCTSSIVVATARNFSYAPLGRRVATVKSAPFAVPKTDLQNLQSILQESGTLLEALPLRAPSTAVLYTDSENGAKARRLFEHLLEQRLSAIGVNASFALTCSEDEAAIAKSLRCLLMVKPTLILIASTTSPAGPSDAVGRAMQDIECHIEKFLAPVEPGNLLLLGYHNRVPILSAPGCFRSSKTNVLDLMLPPLLAEYRVSGWEIAALGHGGLLG